MPEWGKGLSGYDNRSGRCISSILARRPRYSGNRIVYFLSEKRKGEKHLLVTLSRTLFVISFKANLPWYELSCDTPFMLFSVFQSAILTFCCFQSSEFISHIPSGPEDSAGCVLKNGVQSPKTRFCCCLCCIPLTVR